MPEGPPPHRPALVTTVVVAASCVLAAITFKIFDTDFWQHLTVGRAIWESRTVPDRQIWCWPTYGEPFVLPSWAFRVLLWPFWQVGEVPGLYLWRWLCALTAFGLLWRTVRRLGVRGLAPLPILVAAALIFRQRSLVRPEGLIAVLLVALLWVLETRRAGARDHSLWLIGIAWLWANVHYSYHLGLLVVGVYALEATWRHRLAGRAARRTGRPGGQRPAIEARPDGPRRLWLVLAGCVAVSFLNPFGAGTLAQPFEFFFALRHEPVYRSIGELQPMDWALNDRNGLVPFLILWPLFLIVRALRGKSDPVEAALWLAMTPIVLLAQRFTGFWALVAGLFLARDFGEWVAGRRWPVWTARPWARAVLASGACVVLTGVELSRKDFVPGIGVIEGTYPKAACDFIERHAIRGRAFNHLELGGYLLWRFWPDRDRLPFMDVHLTGNAEVRREYYQALVDPNGWRALDDRYRFDWVMLRRLHTPGDRPMDFLDADTSFVPVFLDDAAALYVRRRGPLGAVADSFGLRIARGGEAWLETLDARVAMDPTVGERLEAELRRLAQASTASSLVLNQLANLMLMTGRPSEARPHLDRAHEQNPSLPDYHFRRGYIALGEGRLEEALREYQAERRVLETSSLDARIGAIHRRLGDTKAARHWYQRAIRLDPGNGAAHDSLLGLQSGPR
jgi:tetratricopeptide repeat protein